MEVCCSLCTDTDTDMTYMHPPPPHMTYMYPPPHMTHSSHVSCVKRQEGRVSCVNLIAGRMQHAHVFIWVPRATCVLTGGGGGGRIHRFSAVFKKAAEYRAPGASQAGHLRNIGLCKRKNAGIREVAAKLQGRAGMKCYEQARRVGRCRALILLSCCLFVVLVSCSVRASLAHSVWRPGESPSRSPMTVK